MKLVTFTRANGGGSPRVGAFIKGDAQIVDLQEAHQAGWKQDSPYLAGVLALLEGGPSALDLAYETVKLAETSNAHMVGRDTVELLAPIPDLPQIRDFLCFEKHLLQGFAAARKVRAQDAPDPEAALREMDEKGILAVPQTWYDRPIFYHPNRLNVVGTGTDIQWPTYSKQLDFELEFGCFIGKKGKDIPRDQARDHIAGYAIFNDISARDEQMKEMPGQLGPGKGKTFDTANVIGPCLVTADELEDPYNLEMVVRVDGEEWGRGNTSEMHWKLEDCIAHVARSETLHTGEFLGSGTVGNGCGLEQMRFLQPNNVVEMEIEGIGIIRNRIVGGPA